MLRLRSNTENIRKKIIFSLTKRSIEKKNGMYRIKISNNSLGQVVKFDNL